VAAIRGTRRPHAGEALGIIETATVAAIIEAADAGLKGAHVHLLELRLADDLGGKGYLLFDGPIADVEAAVEIGAGRIAGSPGLYLRVIPRLHAEMAGNLAADARFAGRVRGAVGEGVPAARASAAAARETPDAAASPTPRDRRR
jgi:microcompartment protein CcmL/EutN